MSDLLDERVKRRKKDDKEDMADERRQISQSESSDANLQKLVDSIKRKSGAALDSQGTGKRRKA